MILVDFSSTVHRMVHWSISQIKPKKINGKYRTEDFIHFAVSCMFVEMLSLKQEHGQRFGDVVLCLDKSNGGYWRSDVYPLYKYRRKGNREESEVNFHEVFEHVGLLIDQLKQNVPFKVVEVDRAEADDIILVLADMFHQCEEVLIYSPDKDMIQAQRDNDRVHQYSPKTKRWIYPENKHDHMNQWIIEHVCLGDFADDVPKIVDHTEFSDNFVDYLKEQGYNIKTPTEFNDCDVPSTEKRALVENFDMFKTNRKGESTGVKDIYRDIKFGPATLTKAIEKHGSLDAWLDSHPLYRKHYERNFKLVMLEGVPDYIRDQIVIAFKEAKADYNNIALEQYLDDNNMSQVKLELPNVFKINRELTADDFGW